MRNNYPEQDKKKKRLNFNFNISNDFIKGMLIILVAFILITIFLAVGAWYFISNREGDENVKTLAIVIALITGVSTLFMMIIIDIKIRKFTFKEIRLYIFRKLRHRDLLLGKKIKMYPKHSINICSIGFYYQIFKHLRAAFSMSLLFYSFAKVESTFWFIYLFLAWNIFLIILSFVQIFLFSPFKFKAESLHMESLYLSRNLIYPDEKVNRKNIDEQFFNKTKIMSTIHPDDTDLIGTEIIELENNKNLKI
ncbi:hypothetical protein [Mycoplasmopsis agassizii]|uniref:Uncharacterized protein n=1 Tax=Mycoplasmopsis agassizii TaxID=33922 RepID=A0ABX4H5P8_9BACT|nr:hypothetical protein [Mycoplasmopsis agassizii]PAF55225.1 hypothetical protein CJF60_00870 [Mycoplasmopsis agassizii]SMC18769.1 hypothetical protein SAMN02745179_00758 [Mycoplasmopsis agassizii]